MPTRPKSHSQLQYAVNQRAYDAGRPEDRMFYSSRQWKAVKAMALAAHPVCPCGEPAELADHIIPRHVRPDLQWSLDNLQGLCWACHNVKTAKDKQGTGRDIKVHVCHS